MLEKLAPKVRWMLILCIASLFCCYTALCLAALPHIEHVDAEVQHGPEIIKVLIYFLISIASFCSLCVTGLITWMFTQILSLRKRMDILETQHDDMMDVHLQFTGEDTRKMMKAAGPKSRKGDSQLSED